MNEELQIKNLKALNVLDVNNHEMFDEITQLASMICEAPISLVSLLDEQRKYFESNFGLTIQHTSIDKSFSKTTTEQDDSLVEIIDTHKCDYHKNNPLVVGPPHIRYYLGAPIKDKDGNTLGALCVMDTKPRFLNSNQKECLVLLSKQTARLFDIGKQSLELKILNDRLVKLSERLSQFSGIAVHDFKEPLRMVKSFIELLNKKNLSRWDERDLQYMNFITDGAMRLENYIIGLLNYTSSLGSRECYISFDFHVIINEIISEINARFPNSNTSFAAQIDLKSNMKLPQVAVHSICKNLLENAFKFSAKKSNPKVNLVVEESADNYFFSIIDNGIGIANDKLSEIVRPFIRLNSRTEFEGIGLGLSIVDSQIQFLNGQLHIKSTVLKGTKVEVVIPKLDK